ncbi:MAG: cytochrome C [Thermomicrobiales bacterium]|nr:cytochrome C [Thermomicrobiales bacterium]
MNTTPSVTVPGEGMTVPRRGASRATAVARPKVDELVLLVVAGALLLVSIALPYWQITLHAPQYPKGLIVQAYVNRLAGSVAEVDGLNHYIGMMKLEDAAVIERQLALVAIPLVALLAVGSCWLSGVWRYLARLPIIIYPAVFVVDLFGWLNYAGHSLDPNAALSSSIKPFTPTILGVGTIGQFSTDANFLPGFIMAVAAAVITLVVTILRRPEANVPR